MTMNKYRKHILLAVFGAMVLYYASDWLLRDILEAPFSERRDRIERLNRDIEKRESDLAHDRKVAKRLELYQAQSLPSKTEVARSLYQVWLLELVNFIKLDSPNVDAGEPVSRRGMYQVIPFAIRGRGNLSQLVRLLFEFYNAGHLHQIRSLTATPMKGGEQLDISLSIEALVLPEATRTNRLNTARVDRLAYPGLGDYDLVVQRNLFGANGATDATDYTYLTAVNYVNGKPEAWFDLRTQAQLLKLRQGDRLQVGPFTATVAQISDTDVLLDSEGELWLLAIGENLAQATAVPPER